MTEKKIMEIYMIDKNIILADIIKDPLIDAGYDPKVYGCESQESGLEMLRKKEESDLVVLCGVLGNGFETAAIIGNPWAEYALPDYIAKVRVINPKAKTVVFTGGGCKPEDARKAGADGYLDKIEMWNITADGKLKLVYVLEQVVLGEQEFVE